MVGLSPFVEAEPLHVGRGARRVALWHPSDAGRVRGVGDGTQRRALRRVLPGRTAGVRAVSPRELREKVLCARAGAVCFFVVLQNSSGGSAAFAAVAGLVFQATTAVEGAP